jgi:hypothetical protein
MSTTLDSRRTRGPASRTTTAALVVWGVFFAACAVYNTVMLVPHARTVFQWCTGVAWPGADTLIERIILPVAVPFAVLVVAFEFVTAVLLLSRRHAHIGLVLSLGWLAALIPFLGWYALANVVLLLALVPLVRPAFRLYRDA